MRSLFTRANGFFDGKVETFKGFEFVDQLVAHLPPRRTQLVHRYGIYSSRVRSEGWTKAHEFELKPTDGAAEKGLRGRPAPLPKLRRNHGGGRNHRMGRWATVSPTRGSRTAHSPGLNRRFCFPFWIENSRCSRPKCPRHGVP